MPTIPLPHPTKTDEVDLNNIVVKNLSEEMGKEILSCFTKAGYDTFGFDGSLTINNHLGSSCIDLFHYGVVNGVFGQWTTQRVRCCGIKVITIDELKELVSFEKLTFPRKMRVRDNERAGFVERLVLDIIPNCSNGIIAVTVTDEKNYWDGTPFQVTQWKYAEEIPESKVTAKEYYESTRVSQTINWTSPMVFCFAEEYARALQTTTNNTSICE